MLNPQNGPYYTTNYVFTTSPEVSKKNMTKAYYLDGYDIIRFTQ